MTKYMSSNPITSIPVHADVVRRLRALKTADQTWDDFLQEMAEEYVPHSWVEEMERRATETADQDVPGEEVFRSSHTGRRSRSQP